MTRTLAGLVLVAATKVLATWFMGKPVCMAP